MSIKDLKSRRWRLRHGASFSITLLALTGCGAPPSALDDAKLNDIYWNDSTTRTRATATDLKWTVSLGGCTGSMIARDIVLTAAHCKPKAGQKYKTGPALANQEPSNMTVQSVIEQSASFDYALVKVIWTDAKRMEEQRYTPSIMTEASQLVVGKDSNPLTTKLWTIGFPTDKQTAMSAFGFAKRINPQTIHYNIGTINGNSGGAVWKLPDTMLISQTNFGAHAYGQAGWNNNNPENPDAWNGGGRMDVIWKQSATLKRVFPSGKNIYTTEDGQLLPLSDSPQAEEVTD